MIWATRGRRAQLAYISNVPTYAAYTKHRQREKERDTRLEIYTDLDPDRYVTSLYVLAGPVNKRPNESIDEAVCSKQ